MLGNQAFKDLLHKFLCYWARIKASVRVRGGLKS